MGIIVSCLQIALCALFILLVDGIVTLRHTFASWLVQSGESLYTVKELLGHSTMAMTERYSHLASKNLKNAVKKLEDSLKNSFKEDEKETQLEAAEGN